MKITPFTQDLKEYLKNDVVIDFENENISELANSLWNSSENETAYIKAAFEFVRDSISHSADINEDAVTYIASDVLREKHGICFSKSHLLAALLRCESVPSGFCYQKLILDDENAPILVYHGLNGVFLKEYNKWIRLDPRGNKPGVDARFSVDGEKLAFPIRKEKGEEDCFTVFPAPDAKILKKLINNSTRTELWEDLPTELDYKFPT